MCRGGTVSWLGGLWFWGRDPHAQSFHPRDEAMPALLGLCPPGLATACDRISFGFALLWAKTPSVEAFGPDACSWALPSPVGCVEAKPVLVPRRMSFLGWPPWTLPSVTEPSGL